MPYWGAGFGLPFAGPYGTYYPIVSHYDYYHPDPVNWHLKIRVERLASDGLAAQAVCDGVVSTVPPDQLPPDWLGVLRIPGPSLPTSPTRLYLTPYSTVLADTRLRDALAAFGY